MSTNAVRSTNTDPPERMARTFLTPLRKGIDVAVFEGAAKEGSRISWYAVRVAWGTVASVRSPIAPPNIRTPEKRMRKATKRPMFVAKSAILQVNI